MPISDVEHLVAAGQLPQAWPAPRPRCGRAAGRAGRPCGCWPARPRSSELVERRQPRGRRADAALVVVGADVAADEVVVAGQLSRVVGARAWGILRGVVARLVPPLFVGPERFTRSAGLAPSVRRADPPALQRCLALAVLGPERFRGGCSFGAPGRRCPESSPARGRRRRHPSGRDAVRGVTCPFSPACASRSSWYCAIEASWALSVASTNLVPAAHDAGRSGLHRASWPVKCGMTSSANSS